MTSLKLSARALAIGGLVGPAAFVGAWATAGLGWARASVAAGAVSAAALLASTAGPAHGFWQRLGLTVGDGWIVGIAALILAGRLPDSAPTG